MANRDEVNPNVRHADFEQGGRRVRDEGVYRLTRRRSEAKGSDRREVVEPQSKVGPEARPPAEPPVAPAAAGSVTSKKSLRRPLLFALLPMALVVGGYFYVTGGAVMSTDNAYVQADMVGLSTDVSGIVREVSVHDNQKVAKGDVLFKLDDLQVRLALDRAEAQIGNTRNDLVALRTSYRNMQAQGGQAQQDVDFNMVKFKV